MSPAWEMAVREWAHAHGFKGDAGGWIKDLDRRGVCQGWRPFAVAAGAWVGGLVVTSTSPYYSLTRPERRAYQAIRRAVTRGTMDDLRAKADAEAAKG